MGGKKAESITENILQQLSNNHQYVIPIEVKDIKNDAKRYARFCFFFINKSLTMTNFPMSTPNKLRKLCLFLCMYWVTKIHQKTN